MIHVVSVKKGHGRGKNLQFPTLNFEIPEPFPYSHGIYAGYVYIGNRKYTAAIHFGPIPTFDDVTPSLEAFLIDTNLDNPPQDARIELLKNIREIKKFENSALLSKRIEKDVAEIKEVLKNFAP